MASKIQNTLSGANIEFEQELWLAADKMRGHADPSEYKHVILGLVFLKYISEVFDEKFNELTEVQDADPEDRDEYLAENVYWVPKIARWEHVKAKAHSPTIGKIINEAMASIEKENASLKGVLPMDYSRPALDKQKLGDMIDLMSSIGIKTQGQKDVLGRVYEYFLSRFAMVEGRGGGEFYTPQSVVQLLVLMLEPYKGRIYDPCCGTGGIFVQSHKFVEERDGRISDISVFGQESNFTAWRLCKMNLAIRQIEGIIGPKNADTFHIDFHKDLKADYIIASPPFNVSDWGGDRLREDVRWKYGTPPSGNANYAWVQHIVHHLAPRGLAGFVLANGSMSSVSGGQAKIRQKLIEDDMVDCMVTLPGQLFYSTMMSVCLWFLAKDRSNGLVKHSELQVRRGKILFIDAMKLGSMKDRTHRDLDPAKDINYIVGAYHSWCGREEVEHEVFKDGYQDIAGFCKVVSLDEVKAHGYDLTPGRYVGLEEIEDDGVPFEEKMQVLTGQLAEQIVKSVDIDAETRKQLARVGYVL